MNQNKPKPASTNPPADGPSDLYIRLVPVLRLMLGIVFVLNGLNWWVKIIDPYPSISDYAHKPPAMTLIGALIKTGILFHLVKAVELLSGIALLTNRFVPLALVASLPVTVIVFVVDVFLSEHLRAHIMGSGALLMTAFLMFAYLNHYRSMLTERARFDDPLDAAIAPSWLQLGWFDPRTSPRARQLMTAFGLVAAAVGLVMIIWLGVMIEQHFAVIAQAGHAASPG